MSVILQYKIKGELNFLCCDSDAVLDIATEIDLNNEDVEILGFVDVNKNFTALSRT